MKVIRYLSAVILVIILSACGQHYAGFEKSKTGLYYQFHSQNPSAVMPSKGAIVDLCMSIRTENDSVIMPEKNITTMMETPKFEGDLFDALRVLIADSDLWFPFSISVIHGSLGAVLLYGAVIWISIIVINVRKAEDQERNT